MNTPFLMRRGPLLSLGQLEQIEAAVLQLLQRVGVAVLRGDLLDFLKGRGFCVDGNRVRIERNLVRAFIDGERARNGNRFSEGPESLDAVGGEFQLAVSNYPQHVHDWRTDEIVPFTTERLVEAVKLVEVLDARGVKSSPPGIPCDVPPALQPIVQYWVAATYSRHGRRAIDPKDDTSFHYVLDMAETLGEPMRSITAWVFSPLTLGGESLDSLLKYADRLEYGEVNSMPSVGCTAPIHPGDAFAVAAAEVIGSAILLQERLALPIRWGMGLFPIDMRSMAMVFGSPENYVLQLMSCEVHAYFQGRPWHPAAGNIHCNAKLPGPQACAEKSSLMTAGAVLGARSFSCAGTLSLDEVFSAEQLLYDIEIKDHVQRLTAGMDGGCAPERCVADVLASFTERGFAGLTSTIQGFREVYWQPTLFERDFLGAWRNSGAKTIRQKAHAMIPELLSQHQFALPSDTQRELDRLLDEAKKKYLS